MGQAESFRRAKSERLFAIQSGPLGPGCAKIAADAVSHLRLSLPNQRSRSVGAAFGRPQAHTAWPCLRGRFFSAVGATLAVARKPSPGGRLPLSRGRFPLSGGNGRRPKGVGMMSRSDRGDRERWHGEAEADEGALYTTSPVLRAFLTTYPVRFCLFCRGGSQTRPHSNRRTSP